MLSGSILEEIGQDMERRQHERFTVVDLILYEKNSTRPVGKVVNISTRGLLVISSKPYKVGEEVQLYIPFKKTVRGMVKFEFLADIRWAHPDDDNPTQIRVGMEFADHPELQTMFIEQLVSIYGAS